MSGIEELKQKTKLSMDEMYEHQSVGNLEKNISGQPDNQTANHLENKPSIHPSKKKTDKKSGKEANQPENQETNKPAIQKIGNPDTWTTRPSSTFDVAPTKPQKLPIVKMTFNLTEDSYKAFNDLYARRILQGRKTEKSDLICEAIQWLTKMEQEKL